jgi:hypothetical protein
MSDLEHCLAILNALRVSEVRYCLSGGDDSGTTELEEVIYLDGRHGPLPSVTVSITSCGDTVGLDERLEDIVANLPDGDWCNNEGGYGTVVHRPQEIDADLKVDCDMTYGEDSDARDFEDDEEFVSSDFDESEPAATITVDDSTLQPPKGDAP